MLRVVGCGRSTLNALKTLQRRVLQEFPGLLHHYIAPPSVAPREAACPLTRKGRQGTGPASDPPPPCGPADWSILHRTLPDLFQLPPLPTDGEPASEATIATLGLSTAVLERLRSIAVFPEDPIHLLGSLSLGYLSQAGLGDAFFSIVHRALARLHGLAGPALPALDLGKVRDTSLYAGIAPDLLDSLAVLDLPCTIPLEKGAGCHPQAVPWSTLAKITERTVILRLGLCSAALRAVDHLWLLRERAAALKWSAQAGLPSRAYSDFYRLADAYLDLALSTISSKECIDSYRRMLRGRLWLADGRRWPLRKLGQSEGVSGERVRQVEYKIRELLKSPELLQHLGYLWQLLDHLLVSGGGARYLSELAGALAEILGWPSTPGEPLAAIVDLSPNYQVSWDAPIRVVLARSCCARCAALGAGVTKALEAAPYGMISFEAALETARDSCRNSRCPELGKVAGFSRSILHYVADTPPGLSLRGEQLVGPHVQSQKGSDRQFLEQILLKAGQGMHFKDLQLEHNRTRPAFPVTARRVYAVLTRGGWSVLWGAGTFVHRDLVTVPSPLIAEIQGVIEKRLESPDAPYLCLNGTLFDQYRDRLRSGCVHNPLALYSCMRLLGSARLDFSEYPYVRRKDDPVPRPPLSALLEDFLLNRPGPVSWDELGQFGLSKMGMSPWQLTAHLKHAPDVLKIGRREFFLHRSHLSLLLDALSEIAGPERDFERAVPLSAGWLYHRNVARCNEAGIKSVACLTALLRHFFPGGYVYPDYAPQALAKDRPEPREKKINRAEGSLRKKSAKIQRPPRPDSVAKQVQSYLANRTSPCKTKELFVQFKDRIKSPDYLLTTLNNKEKFLWYTKDSLIARHLLGWDAGKQAAIEESAACHLERRTRSGKPFGLCSEMCRERGSRLPAIAGPLLWTPVLLQQLLGSGKRFVALGRQRDVFIAADNPHGIATIDDIMFHALVNDYGGVAPKKRFISAMCGSGLATTKLTKLLKGRDCRVIVDDSFIAVMALR